MSERFTHKLLHPDKIDDLLKVHSEEVDSQLKEIQRFIEENEKSIPNLKQAAMQAPLDRIFVLRFILSSVTSGSKAHLKSIENLKETLKFRAENLEDIIEAQKGNIRYRDVFVKHSKHSFVGYLGGLHPVLVVRAGRSNTKGLFQELTYEQLSLSSMMLNEYIFHLCDVKTRETGFLCKQIAIIDLEGFSMFAFDSKFGKFQGKMSHLNAVYYPQLLGKTVIINMPMIFRIIYNSMKLFMPASALEKQAICPGNTLKGSGKDCLFLKKFVDGVDIMPTFLGGKAPLTSELILE